MPTPNRNTVLDLIERNAGILRLAPTFVRRFYMDGGRLAGTKPGGTYNKKDGLWKPERWIASTTTAVNVHPIKNEGLSKIDTRAPKSRGLQPARSRANSNLTLREALQVAGEELLGKSRNAAQPNEFRVLIKILDGHTPIVFHFHADDAAVRKNPKAFKGHRFGKDEAYFFLDRPKSRCPYTHVGLNPGVGPKELLKAIQQGSEQTLELSPSFYQKWNEGFYVPAGVVHRPGSALTLEIQQPSDVYTLLEDRMDDTRFSPRQMHPGFKTLKESFKHIDFKASAAKDILDKYRLIPSPTSRRKVRGATEDWIFPPDICPKFSGKRLRVSTKAVTTQQDCYAVFVWKGKGTFGQHTIQPGDEFFVTANAAKAGVSIKAAAGQPIELFTFFAAPV